MAGNDKIVKSCGKILQYATLRKWKMISPAGFNRKYEKYAGKLFAALYKEQMSKRQEASPGAAAQESSKIIILTSAVLVYLAKCFRNALQECNIEVEIRESYNPMDENLLHIVLAPMCFVRNMPPRYIAVQMEQSISDRWFTPEYIEVLNKAVAVMDYSELNVAYWQKRGIAQGRVFCVPIAPLPYMAYARCGKKTPVMFYGDYSCERRKSALELLSQKYQVKKILNVFREEMERELDQGAIVINIHYYEGAMLETTRICEALSHNCLVVSETSVNDTEFPLLKELVDFVPVGDVDAMAQRLEYWTTHPEALAQRIEESRAVLERMYNRFVLDVGRVLFFAKVINFETLYRLGRGLALPGDARINLGEMKPQAPAGEQNLMIPHPDAEYSKAATYAFYARKALQAGLEKLTIGTAQHPAASYSAGALLSLAQWEGVGMTPQLEAAINSCTE